jgi:hypothetical protein
VFLCGDHFQTNFRSGLNGHSGVELKTRIGRRSTAGTKPLSNLTKRVVQLERDQKADEARIDAVLRKAESDTANLLQCYLSPEALRKAIGAIRDRTALMTRDVRKNMHERSKVARKILEESIGVDVPSQRTRFAKDDTEDAALRTRFFELLDGTPTLALVRYLKDALQHGNGACAESIWLEFAGRPNRHLYASEVDEIRRSYGDADPAKMQVRLIVIANAAAQVDRRIADYCRGGDDGTDACAAKIIQHTRSAYHHTKTNLAALGSRC